MTAPLADVTPTDDSPTPDTATIYGRIAGQIGRMVTLLRMRRAWDHEEPGRYVARVRDQEQIAIADAEEAKRVLESLARAARGHA